MTHDELLRKLGPQPSLVKKAGWYKKFLLPAVKTAQLVRPDDAISKAVRERLVTDEIVDDPRDTAMRDMGQVVSQQQAEIQGLQREVMTASQAGQEAQKVIQQLQQQVQQLGQAAAQTQQVTQQAQAMQQQLGMQVTQATMQAMQAGQEAVGAKMEAAAATRAAQQKEMAWQQYKQQLLQAIEMDPTQQEMQAQAMQMQQMQMQQAMAQQGGQPGQGGPPQGGPPQGGPEQAQQGQPNPQELAMLQQMAAAQQQQGQPQGQPQQPGMQVTAALAEGRRRVRSDGALALKLAMHKTASTDLGQAISVAKEVHEALPRSPTGAAVERIAKDLEGTAAGDLLHDAEKGLTDLVTGKSKKASFEKVAVAIPKRVPRGIIRGSLAAMKARPGAVVAVGGGLLLGGLLAHRYFLRRQQEQARNLPAGIKPRRNTMGDASITGGELMNAAQAGAVNRFRSRMGVSRAAWGGTTQPTPGY